MSNMATRQARREAMFLASLILSLLAISAAAPIDSILPGKPLLDGQFLVSSDQIFKLGFFSPANSSFRYIGIWYNQIPDQTVVWVANRDNPLPDMTTGKFSLSTNGSLSISDSKGSIYWSTPPVAIFSSAPAAKLLPGGNLAVSAAGNQLWQSFDHPTDTLLPGMQLGFNRQTGMNTSLTSWKSYRDPATGGYRLYMNPLGVPELLFLSDGEPTWRSGPWVRDSFSFSGVPQLRNYRVLNISYISNAEETYYQFSSLDRSLLTRVLARSEGELKQMMWVEKETRWAVLPVGPLDHCDTFGFCGAFAVCKASSSPICSCLLGFEPSSPESWNRGLWEEGCKRKTERDCKYGDDGFLREERVKLPETSKAVEKETTEMEVCREECLRNCSCTAYSTGWASCVLWSGDLMDLRAYENEGQDLFVRLASADLVNTSMKGGPRQVVVKASVAVAAVVTTMLFILAVAWFLLAHRKSNNTGTNRSSPNMTGKISTNIAGELEVPLFDFGAIAAATEHFSANNAVGIGGFGRVYKGMLAENQLVAVKRLARNSSQGVDEFMNEVRVIGKLQHRNLVRLLGCCVDDEERILVYEYMPNGSLDSILFKKVGEQLNWAARWRIIEGIARGLLYLHQDSQLRIIHRDLKASNVLLDERMNPKISDFGTARIFVGDACEGTTGRVIGTYGYMSPEYAMDGSFSVKSDVFSFGILVLEIISGRRNRAIFHSDQSLNLLGDAWNLWKEGRGLELVTSSAEKAIPVAEVLKCLQIGLLCVQERPDHRPEMAAVVAFLVNDNAVLPHPRPPGFIMARKISLDLCNFATTQNDVTLSSQLGR